MGHTCVNGCKLSGVCGKNGAGVASAGGSNFLVRAPGDAETRRRFPFREVDRDSGYRNFLDGCVFGNERFEVFEFAGVL